MIGTALSALVIERDQSTMNTGEGKGTSYSISIAWCFAALLSHRCVHADRPTVHWCVAFPSLRRLVCDLAAPT